MDITEAVQCIMGNIRPLNVPEPLALLCKMEGECFGVKGSAC